MIKKDLILRNPLCLLSGEEDRQLQAGQMGAVLARAGVGKTAFLVQLALNGLLRDQKVLHVSLNDPVNKVTLWYEEVFRHIAEQYHGKPAHEIWETILPNRFVMTFRVEGFSVPKLEERLTDLTAQNIFIPDLVIIDGLPFDGQDMGLLEDFKRLSETGKFPVWVTVRTHRHDETDETGLPLKFIDAMDFFDAVIQLQPVGDKIHVRAIKGASGGKEQPFLLLDPESLLVTDK